MVTRNGFATTDGDAAATGADASGFVDEDGDVDNKDAES
jgi:hypothetical protein